MDYFKLDYKGSGGFIGSLGKCKFYCNLVMIVMDIGFYLSKINVFVLVVKIFVNVIIELFFSF